MRDYMSGDALSKRIFSCTHMAVTWRHRTLDVQFREDDCRLRRGHAPSVMDILRRATLNMVRTLQQNFRSDVSIGSLRDRIGRQP